MLTGQKNIDQSSCLFTDLEEKKRLLESHRHSWYLSGRRVFDRES